MNQCCTIGDHGVNVEFICLNQSCRDLRVFCFKCLQNEKHNLHMKDVHKLRDYGKLFENNNQSNVFEDLERNIDYVNTLFKWLKDEMFNSNSLNQEEIEYLNIEQLHDYICSFIQMQSQKQSILGIIQKNVENLIQTLNNCISDLEFSAMGNPGKKIKSELSNINYDLINESEEQQINSIAFNLDSRIMIAGYESSTIKVFDFIDGEVKLNQEIKLHKKSIYCVYHMKKTKEFISGSCDKTIIIFQQGDDQQWNLKQQLEEHQGGVNCLVVNKDEDTIISGSDDTLIKIWTKDNDYWTCHQTIIGHQHYISCISLNETENQIISCSKHPQILIHQQEINSKVWVLLQTINVSTWGRRLCFINDAIFTFQPERKEQLHVYEFNSKNNQFQLTKTIPVEIGTCRIKKRGCFWFFPQQFIKEKQILVNKNECSVNLILVNQDGQFITKQSIDYFTSGVFGRMTDDGQFLITWDDISRKLQIRQLKQ
ncbi:unnamed protein product [Paramecium sonneborni]|uniref:Uncharacterized protein n=1 Tax=Paramecium sonneborni TaxID=65129 RepID=A0A8S1M0J6_9CILI|nr:unnamed protein product [Paramecium sonneborni]